MNDAPAAPPAVPVAFGECFGWFHPAARHRPLARGVVICPPFGVEALWTHRNLRVLADLLAAAGLSVLRFDYPGTGDSPGGEAPELLDDWRAAIIAAVGLLRQLAGTDDVALCGVRLGGLLAAEALRSLPGLDHRLALLAPVVSGAAYARELALWGRMQGLSQHPERVEVAGFSLHAPDMRRLESLDLKAALVAAPPRALFALDIAAGELRDEAWRARLGAAGTTLSIAPWSGYSDFMRETHLAAAPLAAFEQVAAFLADGAVAVPPRNSVQPTPHACVQLDGGATAEWPVTFGRAQDLFGILCAPDPGRHPAGENRPALVILNSGSNHRIGDARYAVLLARGLAAQGIASLRVDLGGIGDSARVDGDHLLGGGPDAYRRASLRLFGRSQTEDVQAALDLLEARGFGPFILAGICSGARAALDAALADPRVIGLAMGNLPSFAQNRVADGTCAAVPVGHRLARALLGDHTRHWITHAYRAADKALERRIGRVMAPLAERIGVGRAAWATRALRTLARRKAGILLVYSRDDPTLADLEIYFGAGGEALRRISGVRCVVIDGTNHSFSTSKMRDQLIACIERQARAAFLVDAEAGSEADGQAVTDDQASNITSLPAFDAPVVSRLRPT